VAEFKYKAKDPRGKVKAGKIQAATAAQAKAQLTKMRLRPITITAVKLDGPEGESEGLLSKLFFRDDKGRLQIQLGSGAPTDKELIVFTKQFSTMISSGVPLIQSLGVLAAQQSSVVFGRTLEKIRYAVENGATLSESIEAFPLIFDNLYVAMVRAGEASGNLDEILLKLTTYIEKAAKIRAQVKSAMFYPVMIVTVAITVISVLLIFVVPTFAKQYQDAGKELPWLTQQIVDLSNFLVADWHFIFGGLGSAVFLFKRYIRTEKGRKWMDNKLLSAPGFGVLFRKLAVGRFCNTMSTMLTSGVNLLEALNICAASSGNKIIEAFVVSARTGVEQGRKLSEPLAEGGLFPKMVISMIQIGEQTGALDEMLLKVSAFYEEEVDLAVKTLLSMIEPVMIAVIGGIVGVIVIAMYLPVFDAASLVG
jgi:type IV pilus assembly protein PilC